ncbi:hypothetical protein [Methylovulum psychrotolerans]|nr:hypothetical protein [Methylovulum psychrotolerans]
MPLLRLAILAPSATEQELALIRQAASLASGFRDGQALFFHH